MTQPVILLCLALLFFLFALFIVTRRPKKQNTRNQDDEFLSLQKKIEKAYADFELKVIEGKIIKFQIEFDNPLGHLQSNSLWVKFNKQQTGLMAIDQMGKLKMAYPFKLYE